MMLKNRTTIPPPILHHRDAFVLVSETLGKLAWPLKLALHRLHTLRRALPRTVQTTLVSWFLRPITLKRLKSFENRCFVVRRWHALLTAAVSVKLFHWSFKRLFFRHTAIAARLLHAQMDSAETYDAWAEAAKALDVLERRSLPPISSAAIGLSSKTAILRRMVEEDDVDGLMWALRQDTSRNVGNFLAALAEEEHVYFLTPPSDVNDYLQEMHHAVHHVCHCSRLSLEERLAFVRELRHAYGRTALVLSGGGSFGHFHFGIIRSLFMAGLMPRVLSGSSAGAIAVAMLCTRTDIELMEAMDTWSTHPNTDFFGAPKGAKGMLQHLFTKGTLHSVEEYIIRLQRLMGSELTFQEAYARSGRVLNIAIVAADSLEPSRVLNYLTAPNVLVWSAVACSSAFPLLFHPQELTMKDPAGRIVPHHSPSGVTRSVGGGGGGIARESNDEGHLVGTSTALESAGTLRRWCDGSLEEDLPMRGLGELFGANYFLVSQCNPWLIPVLAAFRLLPRRMAQLAILEVKHRCGQLLAFMPRSKFLKIVCQPWEGDLTLRLPLSTFSLARSAVNFTSAEIMKAMHVGQRAVWAKLPAIRAACAVEVAIDAELRVLTLQARAVRRREEHAINLSSKIYVSFPSWMDLKSLGFGGGGGSSSDSNDDIKSLGGGPKTPRAGGSVADFERLQDLSARAIAAVSSTAVEVAMAEEEEEEEVKDEQVMVEGDHLSEPWETRPLSIVHGGGSSSSKGSTSTGGGGVFQSGVTGGRLEGGMDAWRDLTVLVMGTSDGLDFIAP